MRFLDAVHSRLEEKSTASQFVPSFGFGRPHLKPWSLRSGTEGGMKKVPMVYTAIDRIAKSASSVPWVVKERDEGRWSKAKDQSLVDPLEYPNDHQTRKFQVYVAVCHLMIAGNALFKRVVGTRTEERWILNPDRTSPIPDRERWISGYELENVSGQVEETIDPSEVIHCMIPDPNNLHWGMSPVKVLNDTIKTDKSAIKWQRNTFENIGVPPFVIMDPDVVDEPTYDRARQEIDAWITGSENARRPLLLPLGKKAEQLSQSASELDFVESRKQFAKEIALVIGHLAAIFSDDAQTYNNLEAAIRYMWENATIPILDIFRDSFNLAVIPRDQRRERLITYDLSGVSALKSDLDERLSAYEKGVRNGIPPNMASSLVDLPIERIPDGDRAMVDARLIPMKDIMRVLDRRADTASPRDSGGSEE